jgi:hypothetical protein
MALPLVGSLETHSIPVETQGKQGKQGTVTIFGAEKVTSMILPNEKMRKGALIDTVGRPLRWAAASMGIIAPGSFPATRTPMAV